MENNRILIVEDEPIIAEDLKIELEQFGYEIIDVIQRGETAVLAAEALKPDLILMDIRLQGSMDGIDAASQISCLLNYPVVFLSAFVDDETLERAKKAEAYGFLHKPWDKDTLRATCITAIYHHRKKSEFERDRQLLRALLDTIPDHIYFKDTKSRFLRINQALSDFFKLNSSEEAIGKTDFDFFTKEHAQPAFDVEQKIIQTDKPPVVVLDVMMPGIGGLDVLQQIKRKHPEIQIILLTGQGSSKDGIRGMRMGAFDYMIKPVNIQDLIKRMNEAINASKPEEH